MRTTLACASVPQGSARAPDRWHLAGFSVANRVSPCVLESGYLLSLSSDKIYILTLSLGSSAKGRRYLPGPRAAPLVWNLLKGKSEVSCAPAPPSWVPALSFYAKLWCEKNIYFHSHLASDLGWVSHSLGRYQLPPLLACEGDKGSLDPNPGPLGLPGGACDLAFLDLTIAEASLKQPLKSVLAVAVSSGRAVRRDQCTATAG